MFYDNKGSFTVEAVIVMSTILMVLIAVMFAFMLLYQNVVLLYSANYAASQGSQIWISNSTDIETGADTTIGKSIGDYYYRLSDFSKELKGSIIPGKMDYIDPTSTGKDKKLAMIKNAAAASLAKNAFFGEPTDIDIKLNTNFLNKTITVELSQKIKVPILDMVAYLGGKKDFELRAKCKAEVADPTEYIRNIDLGMEYTSRLADYLKGKFDIGNLGDFIGKFKK